MKIMNVQSINGVSGVNKSRNVKQREYKNNVITDVRSNNLIHNYNINFGLKVPELFVNNKKLFAGSTKFAQKMSKFTSKCIQLSGGAIVGGTLLGGFESANDSFEKPEENEGVEEQNTEVQTVINNNETETEPDIKPDEDEVKKQEVEKQQQTPEIKELTDAEFEAKKIELSHKIQQIDELKSIDIHNLNKYNCQILEEIINNPKLLENQNFADNVNYIIFASTTPESAKTRILMIDKISDVQKNNPELWNNKNFADNPGRIISNSKTPEEASVAIETLKHPELWNNKDFANNVGIILSDLTTPESVKSRILMIDKILDVQKNNPELYKNFADKVGRIISNSTTPESAKSIILMIDKISAIQKNNPELYKNFGDHVARFISDSTTPERAKSIILMIDKISDVQKNNPKLWKNKNFADKVKWIIYYSDTPEKANVAIEILKCTELWNNKDFANNVGRIIYNSKTPEEASVAIETLKHPEFWNSKDFAYNIGEIISNATTPERAKSIILMIDKISDIQKNNPELYKNFADNIGEIISNSDTPESAKAKINVIEEIVANPEKFSDPVWKANIGAIIGGTDKYTTLKSAENYILALKDAFTKKDLLKSGTKDISDEIIQTHFQENCMEIMSTIDIIGIKAFETTYSSKLAGMQQIAEKISDLRNCLTDKQYQLLEQKINPENTARYKQLQMEIRELKNKYQTVKDGGDMNALKELQNAIATKTKQAQEVLDNSCKLDPQAIVDKCTVLAAIAHYNGYCDKKFIDLIQPVTKENEVVWTTEVNKYIFEVMGFEFGQQLSDKLNLSKSKYIAEILSGDADFCEGFREIMQLMEDNPTKSLKEIFDTLPQNKITKQMFEQLGINYDKWCNADDAINVVIEVRTSVEASKKSAIESLENDFNDNAFLSLPQTERAKIYDALKKEGVELRGVEETVWNAAGIHTGTKTVQRLFKNGERIKFNDLKGIMKTIKTTLNANNYWTTSTGDSRLDEYKNTMYTHFTKDRYNQLDLATGLKEDKTTTLTIRKTDMNDINHSLFLGNHGSCCTAVGSGNQFSAPAYIKNKMITAIEVVDNGNFVGNTMCYIAEVDGKPALILDDIELKADFHNNDTLRDAIFEFAKRMCAEIGQPDMPIYAGPSRHKLDMDVCPKEQHQMKIVGNTGKDQIYLDFITRGRTVTGNEVDNEFLYKIR